MCSKPETVVRKLVLSDKTKYYADNPKELAVDLAGRFKGTPTQFETALTTEAAITDPDEKKRKLVQSRDKKGLFYESEPARARRLAESSRSPMVGRANMPSLAMAGGSR